MAEETMAQEKAGPEVPRLTKEQAAIIGAFTGFAAGPFSDIQEYAEKVFGHPLWTHEFGDEKFASQLREKSKDDFIALCHVKEASHD